MPHDRRVGVVWELRDEPEEGVTGTILVDVDAPLRPFGSVAAALTKGTTSRPPIGAELFWGPIDTEPDGEPVSDAR